MLQVLSSAWALLLGIGLLMLGNGLQGTLLGVRGGIEGYSTLTMSLVMSTYFVGLLLGSWVAPGMIRRVGHVRVFAALASLISAVMVIYPALPNPYIWMLGRLIVGFCFSGVYVTAESWLNNAADNENRGKALSLYMIVMTLGLVAAQGFILIGDPAGYLPFVIASIAVSISFAPILLSISPTPAFDTAKRMTLRELMQASPLGCVGMFLIGGVFSAQFGMSAVYATEAGLKLHQVSLFAASFYVGALFMQFPLGFLSDRMDRRVLIMFVAGIAGVTSVMAMMLSGSFILLLIAAFTIGGLINPLYSLLLAHTNDFLDHDDMASASGGLIFINGLGACSGPVIIGWLMSDDIFGPNGFFLFMAVLLGVLVAYAGYRATQRSTIPVEETGVMPAMSPSVTSVAVEVAQEYAIETELEEQENAAATG
ncbi:MFS transporter [Tritonibacter mobilis]|jgi:MFS family permease|uniref:MFS transporter n=1 Tax=Tritonibacter mobilis TaxID=379347 RepID=UPI000E0D9343|nr:MFS transporter [Tritonibacter mobilis]MCA2007263.1 MFS transporter [Tritonibacter mobilis]NKX72670.1 MFS transporter [Rhodobacteraceae bacterium R_SAG3]